MNDPNGPFGSVDPELPHAFEPDGMFPGLCEFCGVPRAKHWPLPYGKHSASCAPNCGRHPNH